MSLISFKTHQFYKIKEYNVVRNEELILKCLSVYYIYIKK